MITLSDLKRVLNPRLFKNWIEGKQPEETLGRLRDDARCPVAYYLREVLHCPYDDPTEKRITISVGEQCVFVQTWDATISTSTVIPGYFTKLIEKIDERDPHAPFNTSSYINAGELREITQMLS